MSSDYMKVAEALADGADPAMLCSTCPWDRNCITPPTMTRGDVEKQLADAEAKDKARAEAGQRGMPVQSLMTALVFGARDLQAYVCPVFALRLRSSAGRKIADGTKSLMQGWDDSE